mmetsp:Transcript_37114/g.86734  ORF Transcript_37114/g.86734 Transcript_37114/m.86734 type:complete len:417 (-) Transcript_37114:29-1279(-)
MRRAAHLLVACLLGGSRRRSVRGSRRRALRALPPAVRRARFRSARVAALGRLRRHLLRHRVEPVLVRRVHDPDLSHGLPHHLPDLLLVGHLEHQLRRDVGRRVEMDRRRLDPRLVGGARVVDGPAVHDAPVVPRVAEEALGGAVGSGSLLGELAVQRPRDSVARLHHPAGQRHRVAVSAHDDHHLQLARRRAMPRDQRVGGVVRTVAAEQPTPANAGAAAGEEVALARRVVWHAGLVQASLAARGEGLALPQPRGARVGRVGPLAAGGERVGVPEHDFGGELRHARVVRQVGLRPRRVRRDEARRIAGRSLSASNGEARRAHLARRSPRSPPCSGARTQRAVRGKSCAGAARTAWERRSRRDRLARRDHERGVCGEGSLAVRGDSHAAAVTGRGPGRCSSESATPHWLQRLFQSRA